MQALLGRKLGMTQVFDDHGRQLPVTVIEVGPCTILQRKTAAVDGYDAIQCGFAEQKAHRVSKPKLGQFKKAGTTPKRHVRELPVGADADVKAGDTLTAAIFEGVSFVDVSGITKGKGFQGVVRRHGMRGYPQTHGSTGHRVPGSIGCSASPGRVMKGKRMPGQMGNVRRTTQSLRVVQVQPDKNLLLVNGSVAGPTGGIVVVRTALKKK